MRQRVEALGARLVRLIAAAVADPERAIGSLDILSAAERATILRGWNDTARGIALDHSAGAVFGAGRKDPRCRCGGVRETTSLSYAELERARQPAGASSARARGWPGSGGGALPRTLTRYDRWTSRHPQGGRCLSAARSGVSRASACAFMLKDAGAPIVLTHAALRERLGSFHAETVCLDLRARRLPGEPATAPAVEHPLRSIPPMSSTPPARRASRRAVVVEHADRANSCSRLADRLRARTDDRSAVFSSHSCFDAQSSNFFCRS